MDVAVTSVWIGRWQGGRVMRERTGGSLRWVLERQVQGRRLSLTLPATSEEDAKAELALFNRDPAAYVAAHRQRRAPQQEAPGAVTPTLEHLQLVVAAAVAGGASVEHHRDLRRYLSLWLEALPQRRPLASLTKAELVAVLDRHCTQKQQCKRNKMVVALKVYCRWLIGAGRIDPAASPGRWLKVEQLPPARLLRKRHQDAETIGATYAAVEDQGVRDVIRLMCLYGLHHTEVLRLAAAGADTSVTPVRATMGCPIAGVIAFFHQKARRWHRISVDKPALAAAQRLRSARHAPGDTKLRWHILPVLPGELRHSFVVLAKTAGRLVKPEGSDGLDLDTIAAVTGHTSTSTTSAYYDASTVPPMVVLPLRLVHTDDP